MPQSWASGPVHDSPCCPLPRPLKWQTEAALFLLPKSCPVLCTLKMETPKLFWEQCPAGLWPQLPPGCWTLLGAFGPAPRTLGQPRVYPVRPLAGRSCPGLREALPQADWQLCGRRGWATWPGHRQVEEVSHGLWCTACHSTLPTLVLLPRDHWAWGRWCCHGFLVPALSGACEEGSVRRAGSQGLGSSWGWGTQLDMVTYSRTVPFSTTGPGSALTCWRGNSKR